MLQLKDVIDSEKYPVWSDESDSDFFKEARENFKKNGLISLPGFIRESALAAMIEESDRLAPSAFYNSVTGNAFLEKENESFPEGHAHRMVETTTLGAVANDQIGPDTILSRIYRSEDFKKFVEKILDRGPLFEYACRLGALNLSVMKSGHYLRWHFDQSDFVVSLNVQEAEKGGIYEYVSNLRTEQDNCYDAVKKVLEGDDSEVKVLSTPPGSLILFEGRYTMHRVTEIEGSRNRYTALFGYGLKPGIDSTDYLKMIRYGRTR